MKNILIILSCIFSLAGCAPYTTRFIIYDENDKELETPIVLAEVKQDVLGKASYKNEKHEFMVDNQKTPWITNVAEQASKLLILKEIS